MKKLLATLLVFLTLSGNQAHAGMDDCNDLYVGRIWVEKGEGLKGVVLLTHPSDTSGSYWIWFHSWGENDKNHALSLLMAAKMSQHRVNLKTEASDGCSIRSSQYHAKTLYLATNP